MEHKDFIERDRIRTIWALENAKKRVIILFIAFTIEIAMGLTFIIVSLVANPLRGIPFYILLNVIIFFIAISATIWFFWYQGVNRISQLMTNLINIGEAPESLIFNLSAIHYSIAPRIAGLLFIQIFLLCWLSKLFWSWLHLA